MVINAVQHVRSMPGGSQSHLMRADDGRFYVVKFRNNPQHGRLLFNELFATLLAQKIGLPVPPPEVVWVQERLIQKTRQLSIQLPRTTVACEPGPQFGSGYILGVDGGWVWDWLPPAMFAKLKSATSFAGALAFDKWTSNADKRQAIYWKRRRHGRYRISFIDFGFCFNQSEWSLRSSPRQGAFPLLDVYRHVRGWESFEPWLSAIEACDEAQIWEAACRVPPDWYLGDCNAVESLVERLARKRHDVCRLITEFRHSGCNPFPNWGARQGSSVSAGEERMPNRPRPELRPQPLDRLGNFSPAGSPVGAAGQGAAGELEQAIRCNLYQAFPAKLKQ